MDEYNQLLNRAAKLCSSGEKCSFEIREKLQKWGMKETDIEKALDFLIENKFIDDARYAEHFVKDKFRFNKWGKVKISYAMRQKKLDDNLIEDALAVIADEEYETLLERLIAEKTKSAGSLKIASNKAKVFRFAAQRGFSSQEIYKAIDSYLSKESD